MEEKYTNSAKEHKQILKEMDQPQMVVINNHLTSKGLNKVGKQESDFQIKYFKYVKN